MMAVLGELELAAMGVLWSAKEPQSVRAVHVALSKSRDLAYTTVMTVLDRLAKKHLAKRKLEGRAWLYLPATRKANLIADEVLSVLDSAGTGRAEAWAEVLSRLPVADLRMIAEFISKDST